jgi:hypothetical protein
MGANTLSEADRVVQAIWVGIWFGVALLVFFYLTHHGAEGALMRYQRWWAALSERYLTSSAEDEDVAEDAPEPGEDTPGTNHHLADTDAVRAGTGERTGSEAVRISRRMADVELIALLAVQRTAEGKERFSANAIAALIGGTRSEVLAQVRAIRNVAPPPTFPPLSQEQQAAREQLGLS